MKKGHYAILGGSQIVIRRFALLISLVILFLQISAAALVITVQTRNDIYLPLTGSNPKNNVEEVFRADDPSVFKPDSSEELIIKAYDGTQLFSQLWQSNSSHKWAIVVHGYSLDSSVMLNFGRRFYYAGYSVLMPDLRAHGKSGADIVGMGWTDRLDIISWIDLVVEMDEQAEIVLYGVSMGADAVLSACGEAELPENVFAAISDCAYTSASGIIAYHLEKDLGLPSFPIVDIGDALSSMFVGYGWVEASALEQVKKSSVPTLFIHGGGDAFVPVSMCYELYSAAECEKALIIIGGARHAASASKDPQLYWDSVFAFLDNLETPNKGYRKN